MRLLYFFVLQGFVASVYAQSTATITRPSPLTVCKEVTVITEPLLPDGRVDYLTYLNRVQGAGVTPENNVVVPLLQAIGPTCLNKEPEYRREYYRLLGIPPLPEDGAYFIRPEDYAKLHFSKNVQKRIYDQVYVASQRPWRKQEFRHVARWLRANEKVLNRLAASLDRTKYYLPWVKTDEESTVGGAIGFEISRETRAIARAFHVRAMLAIKRQDYTAAKSDLFTCHRLARLIGQSGRVIDALVAFTLDSATWKCDAVLIATRGLGAGFYRDYLQEIDQLASLPCVVDCLMLSERLYVIDRLETVVRNPARSGRTLSVFTDKNAFSFFLNIEGNLNEILSLAGYFAVNWDLVARSINQHFQQTTAILRLPTVKARKVAAEKLGKQIAVAKPSWVDNRFEWWPVLAGLKREGATKYVTSLLLASISDSHFQDHRAQLLGEARLAVHRVGFALAHYHAVHNKYPKRLEELTPAYIKKLPLDPFTDQSLLYRRTADGFRLYSVGMDGQDDGGRTIEETRDPDHRDIVLQVPLPPLTD